ncbi:MAG: exonuclease [Microcoleaceae cyanobacterium]
MTAAPTDFIVIDTEGQPLLREIAIVDHQGNLIYEAWADSEVPGAEVYPQTQPLETIIQNFVKFAQNKTIICHYARQDIEILRNTFRAVDLPIPPLQFECSFELAQRYLPQFDQHSLDSLSHPLNLKRNDQNLTGIHRAKYDALFTFQLYRRMINELLRNRLKQYPNPFGSSRVDTPFQEHIDFRAIFEDEFERLKSCLVDIKRDQNHQSRGAVVIGEPGSGKTHLMMRLAKDLLRTNRLLFIRQPNNPDAVLFHTYSRILESLIQNVPGSDRTQLEHLLANSFAEIIKDTETYSTPKIQKDEKILQVIRDGNLNLFTELGQEETKTKREYWQHIEKRVYDWWLRTFSSAGYAPQILQGIIRFCGYTDFNRRQVITQWLALKDLPQNDLDKVGLESWGDTNQEEISLSALEVLSKLSLLDEPLIVIFDQLEGLGLSHNERLLRSFGEAVKEIFTHVPNSLIILNLFPDRWEQFQQIFDGSIVDRVSQSQIFLNKPADQDLIRLLDLKLQPFNVSVEELFEDSEIQKILQQNSIRSILNTAADYYRYHIDGIAMPNKLTLSASENSAKSSPENRSQPPQVSIENFNHSSPEMEQKVQQLTSDVGQMKQVIDQLTQQLSILTTSPGTTSEAISHESPAQRQLREYVQHQQPQLITGYSQPQVITESDDLGKLTTILESFKSIVSPLELDTMQLKKRVLPEHLLIQTATHQFVVAFLHQGGNKFFHRMRNFAELTRENSDIQFNLCRDAREGLVSSKKSAELLESFRNAANGQFIFLDQEQRVLFETIYQTIVDIQNRDLEVNLTEALNFFLLNYREYWLFQNLTLLTLN